MSLPYSLTSPSLPRLASRLIAGSVVALCATSAVAGDRLLATGGVTQVEGAAGGGLSPWALIAGTATEDHIGVTGNYTHVRTRGGYSLRSHGAALGWSNRVEVSLSTMRFGLSDTVPGQAIDVDTIGAKVRLFGDAVYDQDSLLPQVSIGVMSKRNRNFDFVPKLLGATSGNGTDYYVSATKVWLAGLAGRNVLANVTLRSTNANQFGILGFGGPLGNQHRLQAEASAMVFINDRLGVGAEYRDKPNNLASFKEQAASDVFVAWFPAKNFSLTAAWVDLGNIANKPRQTGWYLSAQLSF
jgi:hypothetical protein